MPAPLAVIATIGLAGMVGAVAVTAVVANTKSNDTVVVERVIDGDTLDVRIAGETERVRLLNIDAPEDNKATGVAECMGPEATAALTRLLPTGTEVTLEYDGDRLDRYGRTLAGVFVDDTLVNATMAELGLAGPLVVGGNDRFFAAVSSGADAAKAKKAGIYGDGLPCTLGATVAAYKEQVAESVPASVPSQTAELTTALAAAASLIAAADAAEGAIDAITWVDSSLRASYYYAVSGAKGKASRHYSSLEAALTAARAAEEAEAARLVAERAEAERAAAEAEAARQAAAQTEASRRQAESNHQQSSSSGSSSTGGSGSTGGGYDGYTGCRAYGGGYAPNATDEKGRPYTKIDCTTKVPIVG